MILSKWEVKVRKLISQLIVAVFFVAILIYKSDIWYASGGAVLGWLIVYLIFFYIEDRRIKKLRNSGISEVDTMDGFQFEHFLVALFKSHNYSATKTPDSGDYGADIVISKDGKKIVVQAKRYKNNVGIQAVQEVLGGLSYYKADEAWVVTNSGYTKAAKTLAEESNVRLLDRNELVDLMTGTRNQNATVSPKEIKKTIQPKDIKLCKECGSEMILRNSHRGIFYGCRNFPKCMNTINVKN